MNKKESAQALREAGLEHDAQGYGIAQAQSPAAGTYAVAGDTVTVTYRMP